MRTTADYRDAARTLREIENADVRLWHTTVPAGGRVRQGAVSSLVVEIVPCDSTECLIPAMKEHGLAIKEVDLGTDGFLAKLGFAEEMYEFDC